MKVLILSKDRSVFSTANNITSDTRKRHQLYASMLREKYGNDSEIRLIGYSLKSEEYGVQTLDDGLALYPTNSLFRIFYLFDVIRIIVFALKNWRPDLVTVQTPWEEGTVGYLYSRLVKAKYLPQLHFDLFSRGWRKEHILNQWRYRVASHLLRHSDGVRVVSEYLKNEVNSVLGISLQRLHVVPVGANFMPVSDHENKEYYKRLIDPAIKRKRVVLFVGNFYPPKNLPLWIEVAERIALNVNNVHFVMAGDGVMFDEAKKYIDEKGLKDRFTLLGAVAHDKLPQVYAAADVFLLTSDHESFGRVVLESYLSGVPVVSTSTSGSVELIDCDKTGIIANCGDKLKLCDGVTKLLADKKLSSRYAKEGKMQLTNRFLVDSLADKMIAMWEHVE